MIEVGKVYNSNNYGKFIVIEDNSSVNVLIEFIDTKYSTVTSRQKVANGGVKDLFVPSAIGVGFIGKGAHKAKRNGKHTIAYGTWYNMLSRCYCEKTQVRNPTYIGCTVDTVWHNFQNFAKWFNKNYTEGFQLDKDLLSGKSRGKLYSPQTCCFVPHQVNSEDACAKDYTLISPLGARTEIYNLTKFYRSLGMSDNDRRGMHSVCQGKIKQFNGWRKAT